MGCGDPRVQITHVQYSGNKPIFHQLLHALLEPIFHTPYPPPPSKPLKVS